MAYYKQSFKIKTALFVLTLIFQVIVLNAQNSWYARRGKIYLTNDSVVAGVIRFRPTHPDQVDRRPDTGGVYKTFTVQQVRSFELDTLIFEPRIPRGGDISRPKAVFMEVVVKTKTGLNMYIEYYQEMTSRPEVATFYVSLPDNKEEAYDLNSFKFIPKFDDKASKIVEACPELAEKIRKKEKGYFYNLMNQKKAPDIWADIILEYKKCIGD